MCDRRISWSPQLPPRWPSAAAAPSSTWQAWPARSPVQPSPSTAAEPPPKCCSKTSVDRPVSRIKGMTVKTLQRQSARERLLAAADQLFYAEGVHVVGVDRIAERAGVTKATL